MLDPGLFVSLVEGSPNFVAYERPEGGLLYLNPAARSLLGMRADEDVSGTSILDFLSPATRTLMAGAGPVAFPFSGEFVGRGSPGIVSVDGIRYPLTDADGNCRATAFVAIDARPRRASEQALHQLTQHLEGEVASRTRERDRLWRLSRDLLAVVSLKDDRLVSASPSWRTVLGYSADQLRGQPVFTFIHPDHVERTRIQLEKLAHGTRAPYFENLCRHADGSYRWMGWTGVAEGGLLYTAARDVTSLKEAEAALRRSERAFQDLYYRTPVALHSLDPDGRLLSVSDRWLEFMGYAADEVLGRHIADFATEETVRIFRKAAREVRHFRDAFDDLECQMIRKSGEIVEVLLSARIERDDAGRHGRTMGVMIDVTARKRAEEQLRQSQKMEVVGQLTGGVAHDFNNLLTAIIGNLELLRERLDEPRLLRMIDGATEAADRGARLTEQLLAFSRRQRMRTERVDLNRLVTGMADLLDRTMGGIVAMRTELDPGLRSTVVDPTQIELVILNLAINARDAMPEGGTVTISTGNRPAGNAGVPAELGDRDCVLLSVADTGTGMSPDVLERAFEPFFTTKDVGKGSGLGLSQVYGVIRQSGGAIAIDSVLGRGTTIRIWLPAVAGLPAEAKPARAALPPAGNRGGRILVINDDSDVRQVTVESLSRTGYTVLAVDGAESALSALAAEADFDLLLVDVAMPGVNGIELVRRIRADRPQTRVLFLTGYADISAFADQPGSDPVLQKPFRISGLASAVEQALR